VRGRVRPGDLVTIPGDKVNILMYPDKESIDHWYVLSKRKGYYIGRKVLAREITPYEYHCWSCGARLSSLTHETCQRCHWLKCTCEACQQGGCRDDRLYMQRGQAEIIFS